MHLKSADISVLKGLQERSLIQASIGQLFLRTLLRFIALVKSARYQVPTSLARVKCLNSLCFSVRYLMYGGSISWVPFLYHLVSFTFCLLLTMFQSGWKLSPLGLMILKLLQSLSGLISFAGLEYRELS